MRTRFLPILFSLSLFGSLAQASNTANYYSGISQDAEAVFVIDLGSLSSSSLVQMVEMMIKQQSPDAANEDPNFLGMGISEHLGASKPDLGKMVISTSDFMALQDMQEQETPDAKQIDAAGMVMAFQVKKAVTKEQFAAWVESQNTEGVVMDKKNVGDGIMFVDTSESKGMATGMLPVGEEAIIFVGGQDTVSKAIKAQEGTLPNKLAIAQTMLPSTPNILLLAAPSEKWKASLVEQAEGEDSQAEYIKNADEFALGLNLADGIKLLSGIKFGDAATAKSAYEELSASVTELQSMPMEGPMMMVGSIIKNIQTSENGDTVTLTTQMSGAESQQMLMMLPVLFMQMQMQQEGGAPAGGGM